MCNNYLIFLTLLYVINKLVESQSLLKRIYGEIDGENYSYYNFMYKGNLMMVLESIEGDADMYVSSYNVSPTYHPEDYDLHSATCGIDSILIPKTFRRPINVGVFGHFTYDHSKYYLDIYKMSDTVDDVNSFEENSINQPDKEDTIETKGSEEEKKEVKEVANKKGKKKLKIGTNNIWPFLELFEMIFL